MTLIIYGDCVFKSLNLNRYLDVDDIPQQIYIDEFLIIIQKRHLIENEIYLGQFNFLNDYHQTFTSECNTALFIANGWTTAIIFNSRFYYIFDSHSKNLSGLPSPDGFQC